MSLINSGESAAGIENLCVRGRLLATAAMVTPEGAHGYSWSNTLAARGLEERRDFKGLLTESVGCVHFS